MADEKPKEVRWIQPAKNALSDMPQDVKDEFGQILWDVQRGDFRGLTKMTGFSPTVLEAAADGESNLTYRLFLSAALAPFIFVLDAMEKKSTSGRNLPQVDKDRINNRLKAAKAVHAALTTPQPKKRGA